VTKGGYATSTHVDKSRYAEKTRTNKRCSPKQPVKKRNPARTVGQTASSVSVDTRPSIPILGGPHRCSDTIWFAFQVLCFAHFASYDEPGKLMLG
jgi:hypothetical protein